MNQEERKVLPDQFRTEASENSDSSVNSEERDTVCDSKENGGFKELESELGSSRVSVEGQENVVNQEEIDRGDGREMLGQVAEGISENSTNLIAGVVSEPAVVINVDEALYVGGDGRASGARSADLGSSKVSTKEVKKVVFELDRNSCAIDVKCGSGQGFVENCDGEKVCRICHLNSEQSLEETTMVTGSANITATTELIQLGCGCKDELGIAHSYCAEEWFKQRGNRSCEICGQTAKNITGVVGNRFMEEWNERRFTSVSINSPERTGGCWRGQPFCNFLMACLVIAFVLPWFFRVNMF